MIALIILIAVTLPVTTILVRKRKMGRRTLVPILTLVALATTFIIWRAPSGKVSSTARINNRYIGNHWRYKQFHVANIVPEIEQFQLGFKVLPALDPLFTRAQAKLMSKWTGNIYREVEADDDFRSLGSVMPDAYSELLGGNFKTGHYFHYIPRSIDTTQPAPALVFLHGSGGNFKAYTWLLAQVAEKLKMVVIAPSFGFGNWKQPDTEEVVLAAIKDASQYAAIDEKNIHLMGLSNGGRGVSQLGAAQPAMFRSLIFLSPVIENKHIEAESFARNWRERPVLVMAADSDDRIPIISPRSL